MKTKTLTTKQIAYWKGQVTKHNRLMRKAYESEKKLFEGARKVGFKHVSHAKDIPLSFSGIYAKEGQEWSQYI